MAKLLLKHGEVTIEYDGPEQFLKENLSDIIKAVADLGKLAPAPQSRDQISKAGTPGPPKIDPADASVSTLAQKLDVTTGPDLIAAAALSLAIGGTPAFKKRALRDRSREAKTYWKKSYANNFDNYVNRLVTSGRLNHLSGDDYAIPVKEQNTLSSRIAAVK